MTRLLSHNGKATLSVSTPRNNRPDSRGPGWYILLAVLSLNLAVLMAHLPAQAQDRKFTLPEGVVLSEEQRQSMKADVRRELRQQRRESDLATGNRHGVTATANCLEGYVEDAEIRKSAPDVELVAEQGVLCTAKGCQGWQVEAQRASAELFDIEIVLNCTQEDWVRIEPVKE